MILIFDNSPEAYASLRALLRAGRVARMVNHTDGTHSIFCAD